MKKSLIFVVCLLLIVLGLSKSDKVYAIDEDTPVITCEGEIIGKKLVALDNGGNVQRIVVTLGNDYDFTNYGQDIFNDFDTLKSNFKIMVGGEDKSSLVTFNINTNDCESTYFKFSVTGTVDTPMTGTLKIVIPSSYIDLYEGESFDLECETSFTIYDTNSASSYNENYSRSYEIGNVLDVNSANNLFRINAIDDQFTLNNLSIGDTLTTVHGLSMKVKDYDRDHGSIIKWIDVYFEGTVETECTNEDVNPTLPKNYFKFAANDLVVGNELKITVTDPNKNQSNNEPTYYEEEYVEPVVPIMGIDG